MCNNNSKPEIYMQKDKSQKYSEENLKKDVPNRMVKSKLIHIKIINKKADKQHFLRDTVVFPVS